MDLLELDKTLTHKLFIGQSLSPLGADLLYGLASVFIYALPIILLVLFFRTKTDRSNAVKITLIALIAWQVLSKFVSYYLYTHYGFRQRPFADMGIQELFFEQPAKAFPSDHSAVIMAVAVALFIYKYRRLAWFFLIGGVISTFGRVLIGFHFIGDILGGYVIGLLAVGLVYLADKPLTNLINKCEEFLSRKKDVANSS